MNIKMDEITIKIKFLEDKQTKAILSLNFPILGGLVIKGFRVQESQYENPVIKEKVWLTPPSYQGGGRYHPMFFLEDKELWEKLQEKILREYEVQRNEHFRKKHGLKEEDLKEVEW